MQRCRIMFLDGYWLNALKAPVSNDLYVVRTRRVSHFQTGVSTGPDGAIVLRGSLRSACKCCDKQLFSTLLVSVAAKSTSSGRHRASSKIVPERERSTCQFYYDCDSKSLGFGSQRGSFVSG